jgi:hypothetical protein
MTLNELFENVSTTSGAVATVTMPMGTISRMGGNLLSGKYATRTDGAAEPVKPIKPRKKRAQ